MALTERLSAIPVECCSLMPLISLHWTGKRKRWQESMRAWDLCHTPEQEFCHCAMERGRRKKSWIYKTQPGILLQLLPIKAKWKKIQNNFVLNSAARDSVIFKAPACASVSRRLSPQSFSHFLALPLQPSRPQLRSLTMPCTSRVGCTSHAPTHAR